MRVRTLAIAVATALVAAAALFAFVQLRSNAGGSDIAEGAYVGVDAETADRLISAAMADPWVVEQLADGRSRIVDVIDSDGKADARIRFYNYATNVAYSVWLNRGSATVTGHQIDVDTPVYSPWEREVAKRVALADPQVQALRPDWAVMTMTGAFATGPCADRRCIVVFLRPADLTLPDEELVYVDLGAQEVVALQEGD